MDDPKEAIRRYILAEFLPGESASNLKDDTPLRDSGILDSVATIRMVSFLEEHFGVSVEAHEAGGDDFDTIDSIAIFVASKKSSVG